MLCELAWCVVWADAVNQNDFADHMIGAQMQDLLIGGGDLYQVRAFVMSGNERTMTDSAHAPSSVSISPPSTMNFTPNGSKVACTWSKVLQYLKINHAGLTQVVDQYAVILKPPVRGAFLMNVRFYSMRSVCSIE